MRQVLLALLMMVLPAAAWSQGAATLVADTVRIERGARLIAQGNIEVLYAGSRLTASQIIYDQATDQLEIAGPIIITTADGTILTARRANLDPQLENGMLQSARLVLDQQLQLAAAQIDRADGRYSQLYKTAVTSCQVCAGQAPLWEIRAERVVHDEEERQLYFTNAQFLLRGFPIFALPRMRLPDPTLDRATGFLIPRIRTTNQLSTGVKLPYFITLGDHRDITVTPYLSAKTTTIELEYRQAFSNGDIRVSSAFSRDTLLSEQDRAYLFAEGLFDLGRDYTLRFDIEGVTDDAYLLDYAYSDKDRLDSAIGLTRVREDDLLRAGFTYYQSLREDERDATLPPIVADFDYRRLLDLPYGQLGLGISGDTIVRYGAGIGDEGRDMARIGAASDWTYRWIGDSGIVVDASSGARADLYLIGDDPARDRSIARLVPQLGVTLRYPLVKQSASAQHLLEPVVALAWSEALGGTPPSEDSTRPELDQSNLFALSRFPSDDAIETGLRAAIGVNWTRKGNAGTVTRLSFGRVLRDIENPDFTLTSGLQGQASDWLVAGQWESPIGVQVIGRALLGDDLDPTSAAAKVRWENDWIDLAAAYVWQAADADLGRSETISEIGLESWTQVSQTWAIGLDGRYDLANNSPARAGLELEWRNECVTTRFRVARRYTSSTTVDPSTDYGLSVALSGFSAGRAGVGPAGGCN